MLGNDVVDLADREAAAGATHARFDERVFAASEREAIERSAFPERLRWTLWAAKESAFKAARKIDPRIVLSHRRFEVAVEDDHACTVTHGASRWTVRTRCHDGAVHAVAVAADAARSESIDGFARVASTDADLSAAVRRFAIGRLAARLGVEPGRLEIARRGRIPFVLLDARPALLELSLSHHGAVFGFAALWSVACFGWSGIASNGSDRSCELLEPRSHA